LGIETRFNGVTGFRSSKEGIIRFSPFASTVIYTSIPPLASITSI